MVVNNIYDSIKQFLLGLIPSGKWTKTELNIKIQPGVLGMSGKCFGIEKETSLRTKFDDELEEKIIFLHRETTDKGRNKWNKAKYTLTPDYNFTIEYFWDQEWQDKVDFQNQKASQEDPNYTPPKWHWEE